MAGRLTGAMRALRGQPEPRPVPEPSAAATAAAGEAEVTLDQAIEVLREAPILEVQRRGYHFQRCDYYSALNDLEFLNENRDLWHDRPLPRGVDWNLEGQLQIVQRMAPFARELESVPEEMPEGPPRYHWKNDFWSGADALVHYCLLRERKPRRVVEVGSGWSSLLMAKALERNEGEGEQPTVVDQVEPYARKELLSALPSDWSLHETILQRAPFEIFEALGEGDVCFYDGSHVARAGSDVVWFFAEIVPRLRPGVLIHVHDVFWPSDYPDSWIFERGQTWNEQYMLQAFLMYNEQFEPLICNTALFGRFGGELSEAFGPVPVTHPGASMWMRRRPAAAEA